MLAECLDDEHEGVLVFKDSTVFVPVWAIYHTNGIFEDYENSILINTLTNLD